MLSGAMAKALGIKPLGWFVDFAVAGVPPDYFSAQGQRWGNPIYDWNALARDGYRWCLDRLRALGARPLAVGLAAAAVLAIGVPAGGGFLLTPVLRGVAIYYNIIDQPDSAADRGRGKGPCTEGVQG